MNLVEVNISLAVLHTLLAVAVGTILFMKPITLDFNIRSHSYTNNTWSSTSIYNTTDLIKYGLVFFYSWTALAHTIYATDIGGSYSKGIRTGVFPLRWIEYAVSATVMLGIISIASGVKDQYTLYLILASSVTIMSTGYWFETTRSKLPVLIGFLLLIAVSSVIILSFNHRLDEAKKVGAKIPNFVYGIVYVMLFMYGVFGFVPLLPKKYQEYTYMGLSLTAKALLGAFLAIGAIRPET